MPATRRHKFGYVDDLTIAVQEKHMELANRLFLKDPKILGKFFSDWRLTPSANKTVTIYFYLSK